MELTIDQAIKKGIQSHRQGNLAEAERIYRDILKSNANHPDANHNLGLITASQKKSETALPFFEAALQSNPRVGQFWVSYVQALISEKRFEEAMQSISESKKRGINEEKLRSFEELAKRKLAEISLNSSPSGELINRLLNLYEDSNIIESEKLALKMTQLFPDHPFGWKVLGAVYGQTARTEESLNAHRNAVRLSPTDHEAHSNLANTLLDLGRLEEAEASYRNTISIKHNFVKAHSNLGVALQRQGKLDEAEASYAIAISLDGQYALVRNNLASLLQEQNRLHEAEREYLQSIAIQPKNFKTHHNYGIVLQGLNKWQAAEQSFIKSITLNPKHATTHFDLANLLRTDGRIAESESHFQQAINLESNYIAAYNNLGLVKKELGKVAQAEVIFRKAINIDRNDANSYNNLGNLLLDRGALKEAIEHYRRCVRLDPGFVGAYNNLGNALKELGQIEEAEECYLRALAQDPTFASARFNLGILLFESERFKDAYENFEVIAEETSNPYELRCAYFLEDENRLLQKINKSNAKYKTNAVIGSITSCASRRYDIKLPNSFCNEPLKYSHEIQLANECDFKRQFIEPAISILADPDTIYKEQGHLSNGLQTAGNIFNYEKYKSVEAVEVLRSQIGIYRKRFGQSDEGFIRDWPDSFSISGWLVSMQSGGSLTAHMHDNGWITGSVYINVPVKPNQDDGSLVLCVNDGENLAEEDLEEKRTIRVNTGSLCIFPSSLLHYTVPFDSPEARIVLAFDIIPDNG